MLAALDYMYSEGSLELDLEDEQKKLLTAVRANDTATITSIINDPAVKVCLVGAVRTMAPFVWLGSPPVLREYGPWISSHRTCTAIVDGVSLGWLAGCAGGGEPSDATHGFQGRGRCHPYSGRQVAPHLQVVCGC